MSEIEVVSRSEFEAVESVEAVLEASVSVTLSVSGPVTEPLEVAEMPSELELVVPRSVEEAGGDAEELPSWLVELPPLVSDDTLAGGSDVDTEPVSLMSV